MASTECREGDARFEFGQKAQMTKVISESDVQQFSVISGDVNPLHLDEDYARQTRFRRRIAHGAILVGMISAVLGNDLPGKGTIYMEQSLAFLRPVFLGDRITAVVEIEAIEGQKRIVRLRTECQNEAGEAVARGLSVVLHPMAKRG